MKRLLFLLLCTLLCLPAGTLSAQDGAMPSRWAVVNVSTSNLRLRPDYESSNETQALMGTVVQVLDADRYWRKVSTPEPYVAWTNDLALAYMSEEEKDSYLAAPKWICTEDWVFAYESPSEKSARVCDLCAGCLVRKSAGKRKDWVQILLPDGENAWVKAAYLADFETWTASRTANGEALAAAACRYNGVPYVWGGMSPHGFDCSGLVRFAYFQCGILLPRNAREQVLCGEAVPVRTEAMLPGDLVFYGTPARGRSPLKITHVAMYIGDGRIIHASQRVRICSLSEDGPDPYTRQILAVRRILGHVDSGEGAVSLAASPWYFGGK